MALATSAGVMWTASAYAADDVKIGLAAANLFTAPVFAAQELGYYKAAGLNVEITVFRGGAAGQEGLSAGAVDMITYVGSGVALAVSKGAKEKLIATIEPSPFAWHLLVGANSPYKTVADLAGKKVGVTTKASTSDVLALWAAERAGVKFATVPLGAGLVPGLKSNSVDAISINPTSLQLLANGTARSLVNFGKEMPPTLPDVWVASDEMINKRPDVVRRTLGSIFKALDYMRNNHDWSLAFLKKFTKEQDVKVVALSYQEGTLAQSRDGMTKKEWVDAALAQAIKLYGAPELKKLQPQDFFTDKFLPVTFK